MASPSTPMIDNFDRANEGPPMTGWATPTGAGGLKVDTNQCAGNGASSNFGYWNTIMGGADVEVYCTMATKSASGNAMGLLWRLKDQTAIATLDGYLLAITPAAGTDTIAVQRIDNAVATTLGATISQEVASGDSFMIRMIGSLIIVYYNSGSSGWVSLGTRSDSTYAVAGYSGLVIANTAGRWNDFGGGVLQSYPSEPHAAYPLELMPQIRM